MQINKFITSLGFGLAFVASAQASTIQLIMNQSNVLTDSTPYLSVTIDNVSDNDDGGIAFTVRALADLNPLSSGENFGIKTFAFNGDFLLSGSIEFTGAASGYWIKRGSRNISEFGKFQTLLEATGGNKTVDPLTFVVHKTGDSIADYTTENTLGNIFAAHVIDFNAGTTCCEKPLSAWFSGSAEGLTPPSAVPVPAAAWLLGSGLIGLVGVARRREIS